MNRVRIIPLGGLGEIGKNMTVVAYNEEMYVVDAGISFPDEEMYGVDVVIPDFDFLRKNKEKIKSVIITHGHEDHIGALPYLMSEIEVPVYATKLTAALIRNKLKNSRVQIKNSNEKIQIVKDTTRLQPGNCSISFFRTNHSIPDSVGVVIETPLGNVVHTGDFKFDFTPADKKYLDFHRLGEIGKKGVLALLSDSTNAQKSGISLPEEVVKENLKEVIKKSSGKVIITTFASSLHRVQNLIYIAKELNKKIIPVGRSMENNVKIASKLNYLTIPENTIISVKEMKKYPEDEIMIVTTGAQGETMAGLSRMASGMHKQIVLEKGDTVIFSSSPIPGNEKSVGKIINSLLKKGVSVIDKKEIHTSGHGYQEEQKLMLSIFRPKYFIPCHGEYRMLLKHKEIAETVGIKTENIFVCENGDVVEINEKEAKIIDKVKAEAVLVDDSGMGDVDISLMRDRKRLATHGVAVVQVNCEDDGKKPKVKVSIIFKGIVGKYDKVVLNKDLTKIISLKIEQTDNLGKVKKELYDEIGDVVYRHIKRKPMIVLLINGFKKKK